MTLTTVLKSLSRVEYPAVFDSICNCGL